MDVYDSRGSKLGQINEYGTASDNDDHKVGDVGEDGGISDSEDTEIGMVNADGTVVDGDKRRVGHIGLAAGDPIYLAAGAALLLLLHPHQAG